MIIIFFFKVCKKIVQCHNLSYTWSIPQLLAWAEPKYFYNPRSLDGKKVLSHSFAAFHQKTQIFFHSFHEKNNSFFYSWNWKKFWVCLLFASDSTFPSSSTYVCNLNWDNRSLECHDFNVKLANRSLSKIILTPQHSVTFLKCQV